MNGRVVHFEVPADDLDRAREFYRSAFDWVLQPVPGMGFLMVETTPTDERGMPIEPGSINGGLVQRTASQTTPVVIIDVDDIDKALETVTGHGGVTVRPREHVMDIGFTAYFRDTEGNLVGLWQNA